VCGWHYTPLLAPNRAEFLSICFCAVVLGPFKCDWPRAARILFSAEIDDFGIEIGRNIQESIVFLFQIELEEGDGAGIHGQGRAAARQGWRSEPGHHAKGEMVTALDFQIYRMVSGHVVESLSGRIDGRSHRQERLLQAGLIEVGEPTQKRIEQHRRFDLRVGAASLRRSS
jgi:hypothetical protein